jgi:hypothetical protein
VSGAMVSDMLWVGRRREALRVNVRRNGAKEKRDCAP